MQKNVRTAMIAAAVMLASGCASMAPPERVLVNAGEVDATGKTACGSFFVYEMCLTDARGDRQVDYIYFSDSRQIFMFQPGVELPAELRMHSCAISMSEAVVEHSSALLYGERLSLLQEMDVKRKLLLSYMAAREEVEQCYGGDSRTGKAGAGEAEFASDEFDWGEE